MSAFPVLTSIVDKNNAALLTFTRDGNNAVQQVSDRYGRSVYYHVGSYATTGVPVPYAQSYPELDHVSQVVATGTASPPDRHVFGYQNVGNGEGSEAIPLLHTLTAPSFCVFCLLPSVFFWKDCPPLLSKHAALCFH